VFSYDFRPRPNSDPALDAATSIGGPAPATEAREEVTAMGGRVSLDIGELAVTHQASVDGILRELVVHERRGIEFDQRLLKLCEDEIYHLRG
jgi:hypothetical protein